MIHCNSYFFQLSLLYSALFVLTRHYLGNQSSYVGIVKFNLTFYRELSKPDTLMLFIHISLLSCHLIEVDLLCCKSILYLIVLSYVCLDQSAPDKTGFRQKTASLDAQSDLVSRFRVS